MRCTGLRRYPPPAVPPLVTRAVRIRKAEQEVREADRRAVAIANAQTAVYPYETPGGWNIIGSTPLTVFDPARDPASLFAPGDRVRFVPISRTEYEGLK